MNEKNRSPKRGDFRSRGRDHLGTAFLSSKVQMCKGDMVESMPLWNIKDHVSPRKQLKKPLKWSALAFLL